MHPPPRHQAPRWTPPPGWPTPFDTARLHVRRLGPDDAAAFHALVGGDRDRLLPWMDWAASAHRTVEDSRRRLAALDRGLGEDPPGPSVLGLHDRGGGALVGALSLQEVDPRVAAVGLGFWVAGAAARRGLATEAVRHLLSTALRPAAAGGWGLQRVHLRTAGANVAARGVATGLGLRREVRQRQHVWVDGVGVDDVHGWGVLAAEWDADAHRMRRADPDPDVGVGPHPRPWPDDPRLDPELLRDGDRRNVADRFRYWRHEAVVADLAAGANPFHVAVENWRHDMNIGTVVRTANAFGAAGVHIVGRRAWNRRGAMVTDRYLAIHHHDGLASLAAFAADRDLRLVGVDNLPGSVSIFTTPPPERALLLLGQEGPGLSDAAREAVEVVLHIPQVGSTRSINAGVASGIAMAAWLQAHRPDAAAGPAALDAGP
jgi:RimJ/RimL family protein N-acetyltransferase/tRNA(Leu) C34 or U34 (ribose-2'-O)-methylase TrmL